MIYGTQVKTDPRIYFAVSRLFASRLRVLVVTDGRTNLDDLARAPLGQALGIGDRRWSHLQFDVTTAHRTSAHADIGHFRFDRHDLAGYDQIWVWRADHDNGEPLSRGEVQAISAFLDRGGSIYAARR